LCLIIPMTFANAQFREVGLFLGGTNYIGEVGKTTFVNPSLKSPSTTLFYKSNFSPRFTFRVELGLSSIQGIDSISAEPMRKERANSFSNSINHTSAILEVNYFEMDFSDFKTSWSPYLFAGLSYLKFRDLYYPVSESVANYQNNEFSFAIPMGVGIKTRLGMNFLLGFEVKALYTFSDNLDGSFPTFVDEIDQLPAFGNSLSNDWIIFSGFSISYSFGRGWFIEGLL
jgi:outer membrane protein W